MSEEIVEPGKEVEKEEVPPKTETVTTEDFETLKSELAETQSTNKRLLSESKENLNKFRDLQTKLDEKDKEVLEKNEDFKALLEKERDEHTLSKTENKTLKTKMLSKSLSLAVASHATDAHDVKDVINSLDKTLLVIDESDYSVTGAKEAVENLRKDKHWLFKNNKMPPTFDNPPTKIPTDGKLTHAQWLTLSGKDKKARMKEVDESTIPSKRLG